MSWKCICCELQNSENRNECQACFISRPNNLITVSTEFVIEEKHSNEILCMYASDTFTNKDAANSNTLHLRISPFDSAPTNNKHLNTRKLLKYDSKNNIYYFPIGNGSGLAFSTSTFAWPKHYSILMWVRWKQGGIVTTFDSISNTPIYGSGNRVGCASGFGRPTIHDYRLTYNEWQCVIVFGGDSMSKFYVGDLLSEPKSVGEVSCDISGKRTCRIGNSNQGPGDVGCIFVFDQHESMKSLIRLYYKSMFIMGNHWNQTDVEMIKKMLMQCIQIDGIVLVIFQLLLGRCVDQFNL